MKVFARGIVFLAAWAMGLPSARAVSTHYVDERGNLYAAEATAMTAEHRSWPSGWYVVSGTVVIADRVSVLAEAAIDVKEIDLSAVENAQARAEAAIAAARDRKEIDPVELEKLEAVARFAIAQKLVKGRR